MKLSKYITGAITVIFFLGCSSSPTLFDGVAKQTKKEEFRPNWMEWGAQNYPARVRRVTSTSNNSIDLSNNICWSSWCIGFPYKQGSKYSKDYPLALYTSGAATHYRYLVISPLVCVNDVMGEVPCHLSLTWGSGPGYRCTAQVGKTYSEPGNIVASFAINCPDIFLI